MRIVKIIPGLNPYFNLKDELTVLRDLILKGSKIVISSTLTHKMKQILHGGHLVIKRVKLNNKLIMHWPDIYKEMNKMISSFSICQKQGNLNLCQGILLHKILKDVWNKVPTRLFVCRNKYYLIVIDCTSK